jgi:hypothetical protein
VDLAGDAGDVEDALDVPVEVVAAELDLEAEEAAAGDPLVEGVGEAVARVGVVHLALAELVEPADEVKDGYLGAEAISEVVGDVAAFELDAEVAAEVVVHEVAAIGVVGGDIVGDAEGVVNGGVHWGGGYKGGEEGQRHGEGVVAADRGGEVAEGVFDGEVEVDGVAVLAVFGDEAAVAAGDFLHRLDALGWGDAVVGEGPHVGEEHAAPSLAASAGAGFDGDTDLGVGDGVHDDGAELERGAGLGLDEVGDDFEYADVGLHGGSLPSRRALLQRGWGWRLPAACAGWEGCATGTARMRTRAPRKGRRTCACGE